MISSSSSFDPKVVLENTDMNDVAIDFEKLYHEEKRKLKEERLLRRVQQQQQQQIQSIVQECNNTTKTKSNKNNKDAIHDQRTDGMLYVPGYPTWTWLSDSTMTQQQSSFQLPVLPVVVNKMLRPNMIYYEKDFITDPSYRTAFIEWLYQLPTNDVVHNTKQQSTTTTTATATTTTTSEQDANGKWTILPHAQRRVALFDAKIQQQQQSDDQTFDTSQSSPSSKTTTQYLFPSPLQILIDTLIQRDIYNDSSVDEYLPNHILINEYVYPYQGILPHTDGPAYHSKTITITFGIGDVILNFTPIINNCSTNNSNNNNTNDDNTDMNNNENNNSNNNNNDPYQVVLHGNGSLIIFENDAYTNYYHSIDDLSSSSSSSLSPSSFNQDNNTGMNHKVNEATQEGETVEYTGPNCLNATPGTCIVRQSNRISITIRHKF